MTIRHRCEQCGRLLKIPGERTGTASRCPACHAEFVVPPASAAEDSTARTSPAASPDRSLDPVVPPAVRKGRDDFDPVAFLMDAGTSKVSEVRVPRGNSETPSSALPSRKWRSRTAETSGQEGAASNAKELLEKTRAETRRMPAEATAENRGKPAGPPGLQALFRKLGAVKLAMILAVIGLTGTGGWLYSRLRFDLPPLGDVSGRVTLDGRPLAGAIVNFRPLEKRFREKRSRNARGDKHSIAVRTATGVTDADGRYRLSYVENYSGTFVGKNLVYLAPLLNEEGRDRIPASWSVSSLGSPDQVKSVDIVEGRNPDFDIEMKSDPSN